MYKIKDDLESLVVSFDGQSLSEDVVYNLKKVIEQTDNKDIGIDFLNIKELKNDFFIMLKEVSKHKKISLFNVSADINILLFLMNYNCFTKIYSNESDFRHHKREIVKRNFKFCIG